MFADVIMMTKPSECCFLFFHLDCSLHPGIVVLPYADVVCFGLALCITNDTQMHILCILFKLTELIPLYSVLALGDWPLCC